MEKKKISADTEKVKVRLSCILKNIRNEIDLLRGKEGPLKSNPYIVMMKESKWDTNFFLSEYQLIQKKQSHLSSNQRKIIIAAVTTAINEVVMAEQKKKQIIMKLTDSYFEARREAIKWLNVAPAKRNYTQGVLILQKSGYKPQVAALLARQGEKGWTREKLMYCMREMLQVYYTPDDPRFNDEDVDVLNEQAGESNIREHQVDVKDVEQEGPSYKKWPAPIQQLMREYAAQFRLREKASRERSQLPDTNDADVAERRKQLSETMEQATSRLEKFWALRKRYEEQHTDPTDEEIKAILEDNDNANDNVNDNDSVNDADEDLTQLDTETLRIRRKSLVTGRTRKENMLKYQTSSRQRRENPMPDCPKRVKLERQIEKLTERISKYDYELAKRS